VSGVRSWVFWSEVLAFGLSASEAHTRTHLETMTKTKT
jgi:hypothetical protein